MFCARVLPSLVLNGALNPGNGVGAQSWLHGDALLLGHSTRRHHNGV
jgi:hypothetical protein